MAETRASCATGAGRSQREFDERRIAAPTHRTLRRRLLGQQAGVLALGATSWRTRRARRGRTLNGRQSCPPIDALCAIDSQLLFHLVARRGVSRLFAIVVAVQVYEVVFVVVFVAEEAASQLGMLVRGRRLSIAAARWNSRRRRCGAQARRRGSRRRSTGVPRVEGIGAIGGCGTRSRRGEELRVVAIVSMDLVGAGS